MDPNQMLKQMLDFNKSAFDNGFNAMLTIQEQNEKMFNTFLEQATWIPEEGKKLIQEWINTYKKGCEDFKNTAVSRFIRLKVFHIWLDLLNIKNGNKHKDLNKHYSIKFLTKSAPKERVEYDKCVDFSYMNQGTFHSLLRSEYMTFFWAVYQVFGPFRITLKFDADKDLAEFGEFIAVETYNAIAKFQINEDGKWIFKITHNLDKEIPFNDTIKLGGKFGTRK